MGFPCGSVVKNLPANAGDIRYVGSIPGSGRSLEEGNGNPLQYSCLGNPMDRGAWQATVLGVAKSWTRLSTHRCISCLLSYNKLPLKFGDLKQQTFIISISMDQEFKCIAQPNTFDSGSLVKLQSSCQPGLRYSQSSTLPEESASKLTFMVVTNRLGFSPCGPLHRLPECSQDIAAGDPSDRKRARDER